MKIFITIKIFIDGVNLSMKKLQEKVKMVLRILKEHCSDIKKFKYIKILT